MTESRKFELEYKVPMPAMDRAMFERQMALYFDAYRECQPMPVGNYAEMDAEYTMQWWARHKALSTQPVLVNKLRGRATQTLFSLNELIHPGTIERMTPKPPTVTSQPLYDDDWRAYGCGCVR